jgi:ABC-type multidrug transport system fused ATPase/permease subunit
VRTNRPSSQSPTPGPHPSDSTPQPLWWDQEPEGDAATPAPVFAPREPDVVVSTDRPSSESPTPGPHPSDSTPQPLWWDQEPGSVADAPEKRLAEGPAERPPVDRNLSDFRRAVRLFRRFGGSRKVYLVGVLLLTFEALTSVIEPFPIAYLIDFLQGARPSLRDLGWPSLVPSELVETLLLLTIAIVGIAAVNSAADSLTEVCMARGGRSLGYNIRVAMYSHLQRLSLSYHDKKRTGDVLTRVTGDVLVVEEFVVGSISNILGSLLVLVGSLSLLFYRSWKVALVAMVVCPLLALVSNFYSRRIKTASKTQRSREGELASTAQEMLTSIRLVQSYGRGRVDLEQFSSQTEKSMRASLGAANIQAQFSFVVALMEALAICAVVWLGVWLVEGSAITIGTLVLFVLLLQNMFKPARKIVSEWYKIGKVFASVDRIDDLLDREVAVQDEPDAVAAPTLTGALKFDHVSFAYPAEHEDGSEADQRPKVLHDIDFEVAAGEIVSLVGSSGAGKSTIAQLVPRLYDPDEGAVLVDGMDVHGLTLTSLRSQVSLVLQDTVLLNGSVAENIGYGIADATPERIEAAARMANAHTFITAMPDGYDTQLGERGAMLSGGQRQRIAIARAFIRETPILILDEPTTGLDLESTQLVLTALRSLMRGKTTIIISHDLGLIRCADRILVIADGRIAESGEHRELMSARGLYAELYESEFDGENPYASGNGSGSSEEGRYGDNSDYVTVAPRQAEPVTRPTKRDGIRSIRPGARWRMTP